MSKILLKKDHIVHLWIRQPIQTDSNGFQYHTSSKVAILSDKDILFDKKELRQGYMTKRFSYRFPEPLPLYDNKEVDSMEWYYE